MAHALQGLWVCFKALLLPGQGDPYVRFNQPGRPVLDGFSALLACTGLIVFARTQYTRLLSRAGRILVITSIFVMLLPSALATAEITPSNLRMVGLFPFLALLPALGFNWILSLLPTPGKGLRSAAAVFLFLFLGTIAWKNYADWSRSTALFYAADGEMVLAARAVDDEVDEGKTVYVSSEHFQHPTVAALSSGRLRYPRHSSAS